MFHYVYQNEGKTVKLGKEETHMVSNSIKIPIKLKGYNYAGTVVYTVSGHDFSKHARTFNTWFGCSIATSKKKKSGELKLNYTGHAHHGLTCRKRIDISEAFAEQH